MKRYKVGKGKAYQNYLNQALLVMFEAGIEPFVVQDVASWSGLPAGSVSRYMLRYVRRGLLIKVHTGRGIKYWFDPDQWTP